MSLDKLDLVLMRELENDARQPVRALARKLGLNRETVRSRLNRLSTKGILSITCVINTELMGYQFVLVVGINVSHGKADTVANQLMSLPSVKLAFRATGHYDLMAWALMRDRSALVNFISEEMASIADITSVESMHCIEWVKDSWGYFKAQMETPRSYPRDKPSDLDLSIINAMRQDPRQGITKLAKAAGCSRSVAKTRLEKLLNDRVIKFANIVDVKTLEHQLIVMILIKSKPDKVHTVANELSAQDTVKYVSLVTSQWQILVGTRFEDNRHMYDFLAKTLPSIPDIMGFEVVHMVKPLKYSVSLLDAA